MELQNDIEDRKAKVQVYKLSELVRLKNKQLAEKDRELERFRQRQITDENTSFTINRHWNNVSLGKGGCVEGCRGNKRIAAGRAAPDSGHAGQHSA